MSRSDGVGGVVAAFKPEKPPKRAKHWTSSVNYESERHLSNRDLRNRLREQVYARDQNRCRADRLVPSVRCGGELDVHEVIPRSAWKAGYLVLWNCLTICRQHHDWIGAEPTEAHRLGLHGYSWEVSARRRKAS